jgi:hypothetical protein
LPELAAAGAHRANILMFSQPGNAPFPTEDVTFFILRFPGRGYSLRITGWLVAEECQ